jgi:hypothetical protein
MRFALCLAITKELDKFRTNRLQQHADRAFEYWNAFWSELCGSFRRLTFVAESRIVDPTDRYGTSYIDIACSLQAFCATYPWLQLDTKSQKVVDALSQLHSQLNDRIKDKKDLSAVTDLLRDLGAYLYSAIPEASDIDSVGESNVSAFGNEKLYGFAEKLLALPSYRSEPPPISERRALAQRAFYEIVRFSAIYSQENPFLLFAAWSLSTGVIVSLLIWGAFHFFPAMTMDSTVVSLLIGTPLLVGAAALTLTGRGRRQ